MIVDIPTNSSFKAAQNQTTTNIYFKVLKDVQFGCGIYVVGNYPTLGFWDVSKAKRLNYGEDKVWRGVVTEKLDYPLEYKYIVANYQNPLFQDITWEHGQNRVIYPPKIPQKDLFVEQKWNCERIIFQLSFYRIQQKTQVFILGSCVELGLFISPITLHKASTNTQTGETIWRHKINIEKYRTSIKYCYVFVTPNSVIRSKIMTVTFPTGDNKKEGLLEYINLEYYPGYRLIKNQFDQDSKLLKKIKSKRRIKQEKEIIYEKEEEHFEEYQHDRKHQQAIFVGEK